MRTRNKFLARVGIDGSYRIYASVQAAAEDLGDIGEQKAGPVRSGDRPSIKSIAACITKCASGKCPTVYGYQWINVDVIDSSDSSMADMIRSVAAKRRIRDLVVNEIDGLEIRSLLDIESTIKGYIHNAKDSD